MFPPDCFLANHIMKQRVQDRLREVERRRLLRQAGIYQPSWLSCRARQLLSWFGHLLVGLGQRLECCEASSASSV